VTSESAFGSDLLVNVREHRFQLSPGQPFTFGRAESCTFCLDKLDRGISRIAGAFIFEHGTWWIINRSETRSLHIVDAVGLSVPLPVSRSGWPSSRRAIDPEGLRVLVTGAVWTHELRCVVAQPFAQSVVGGHTDWPSTATQTPSITDARKEVLVALVSGYLKPFPRYDPRPLTYSEIAEMVGLPRSTVTKRVEAVRTQLKDHGVPGLDEEDARRPLAEWLLSMRLIVPADLEWLVARGQAQPPTAPEEADE
jgi:hypothetical protein